MVVELCWKCLVCVPQVQRAPAPPKESRPIKDQAIKSKTGWKKMKLAMEGSLAGNVVDQLQHSLQYSLLLKAAKIMQQGVLKSECVGF